MGSSISRVQRGADQPVDYLRNLEEIADVKLEFDDGTNLWAFAVYPNLHSSISFEPILHFGVPDDQLESTIRTAWLNVMNALTNASDAELEKIANALNATVPKDYDPQALAANWIPTPVRDTWESPTLVEQWRVERGVLRHFNGPIVMKTYGLAHQLFAPAGNFLPVEHAPTPSHGGIAKAQPGQDDAALRAIWRVLFKILKWAFTLTLFIGVVVGIGYLIVHFIGHIIAFFVVLGFIVSPFLSTDDN